VIQIDHIHTSLFLIKTQWLIEHGLAALLTPEIIQTARGSADSKKIDTHCWQQSTVHVNVI